MCAAGAGPGGWRSWARVGGMCSADNCHALYCTRPQSLPGPYAFQGISPSSQGPSPTCLGKSPPRKSQEDRDQGGSGPHFQRPPSLTLLVPFLSYPQLGLLPRTNRVWGRHILAGSPWRLLPQGCSNHPRSPGSGPGSHLPQPAMGPHQPGPTPTENPKSYCI